MIIPMPIFMPSGSSEPITMPHWLAVFGTIVIIALFIGVIGLLIYIMLSLILEYGEPEWLFKIAGCVLLLSAIALLVFVILLLFFGKSA